MSSWDEIDDDGSDIIGTHVKCAKGQWYEGKALAGSNVKFCILMDTATVGEVRWEGGAIVERRTGRFLDNFKHPKKKTDGWSPSTSFLMLHMDEENSGQFATFTSTSWGGVKVWKNLYGQFKARHFLYLPICVLRTEERGDENRNVDPFFHVVAWSACKNFQELLTPAAAPALPAPPTAPEGDAEIIDADEFIEF